MNKYWLDKKFTEEHKMKIKNSCKGINKGEENGVWKGDKVGNKALHEWITNHLIKPQVCRDCNQNKPLDLANISQEYKRELSDWEWLCRSCHMTKDGRLDRFISAGPKFLKGKKQSPEFIKRRIELSLKAKAIKKLRLQHQFTPTR